MDVFTFRETLYMYIFVICKENVCENIERNKSFMTKSSDPKSRRWQVYFFASRYLEKIFGRTRERKMKGSRIVGQETRERERGRRLRCEELLGIFVELNTPVNLEAPHLCRAYVT